MKEIEKNIIRLGQGRHSDKFLIEEKQRNIKYLKKQREIQHRHYHAMLKMAHASMARLKKVKAMVHILYTLSKICG